MIQITELQIVMIPMVYQSWKMSKNNQNLILKRTVFKKITINVIQKYMFSYSVSLIRGVMSAQIIF